MLFIHESCAESVSKVIFKLDTTLDTPKFYAILKGYKESSSVTTWQIPHCGRV